LRKGKSSAAFVPGGMGIGKVTRTGSPVRFSKAHAAADSGESGWMVSPVWGSKAVARRGKRSLR